MHNSKYSWLASSSSSVAPTQRACTCILAASHEIPLREVSLGEVHRLSWRPPISRRGAQCLLLLGCREGPTGVHGTLGSITPTRFRSTWGPTRPKSSPLNPNRTRSCRPSRRLDEHSCLFLLLRKISLHRCLTAATVAASTHNVSRPSAFDSWASPPPPASVAWGGNILGLVGLRLGRPPESLEWATSEACVWSRPTYITTPRRE
jgi:hypothetical protein